MRKTTIAIAILVLLPGTPIASQQDIDACLAFVNKGENYKIAHKNSSCLKAANEGSHAAQYSVGMSYGFDGNHDLEESYYRLSAAQGNYAAYLGLGHVLSYRGDREAVYWYKRYITAIQKKPAHDGSDKYAATLITQIYRKDNDRDNLEKWLSECKVLVGECGE